VVDEGPGLSGSSFAAVSRALHLIGVPDERIVLFPSVSPDDAAFVSETARERWRRHRKYTVSFDDLMIRSGRLARAVGSRRLVDLSAGRWRRLFYTDDERPAVHPHHERRKYLLHQPGATPSRHIARFAGLGRAGHARYERAMQLAASGWGPAPLGLREGFLVLPFVPGRPLDVRQATRPLMDAVVRYLTRIRRGFAAPRTTSVDAMLHMIDVNATEAGLRPERDAMHAVQRGAQESALVDAVAVDGRMLPHEWLATDAGPSKVDALDHHDDHFFPGITDPAWDLAAALVEFAWPHPTARALVTAYKRATSDHGLETRLPFLATAYLAFRVGYCTRAAATLADSADGRRFAALGVRYRGALAARLDTRWGPPRIDRRGARTLT
jgi:hypothetical protein